jgi:hypothetical protein
VAAPVARQQIQLAPRPFVVATVHSKRTAHLVLVEVAGPRDQMETAATQLIQVP